MDTHPPLYQHWLSLNASLLSTRHEITRLSPQAIRKALLEALTRLPDDALINHVDAESEGPIRLEAAESTEGETHEPVEASHCRQCDNCRSVWTYPEGMVLPTGDCVLCGGTVFTLY